MGVQKNRLIETVLLSTHNICLDLEIRKLLFCYTLFNYRPENLFFFLQITKQASSEDFGIYCMGQQQRLIQSCASTVLPQPTLSGLQIFFKIGGPK